MYVIGEGDGDYAMPEVLTALRAACLSRAAVPVLCGASLRGIGVDPLLDSITAFLPSPLDRYKGTLNRDVSIVAGLVYTSMNYVLVSAFLIAPIQRLDHGTAWLPSVC